MAVVMLASEDMAWRGILADILSEVGKAQTTLYEASAGRKNELA